MRPRNYCKLYVLFLSASLLTACAFRHQSFSFAPGLSGYCDPPVIPPDDAATAPLDTVAMRRQSPVHHRYSEHSLMVANATGVLPMLKRIDIDTPASTTYWIHRQQVLERLIFVTTQIQSIAAELDCEGERAEQIAQLLMRAENGRVKKLTVLSIVSGALGGIGNAVLSAHGAAVASAVAGGSLSAGLGLTALASGRKVEFIHKRNLLADIWNQVPVSEIYPRPVWFMLSQKYFSNGGIAPVASNIRSRWIAFDNLGSSPKNFKRLQTLLFKDGGKYSADELQMRARMINQVQAAVKLINQDILSLMQEVGR